MQRRAARLIDSSVPKRIGDDMHRVCAMTATTQPRPNPASRPMTPKVAAEFLGLDAKTITRWARKSYLPAHLLGEGKPKFWRFFEFELLAWVTPQANGAVAE
jgi:hypothetical protein